MGRKTEGIILTSNVDDNLRVQFAVQSVGY